MKIIEKTVTKRTLTELDALDPVTFIAEDFGPGQGKLTIDCYGKSWTNYWGGMGSENIMEFISTCNTEYIADKMFEGRSTVTDYNKISDDIGECVDRDSMAFFTEKLTEKYGSDWCMDLPTCNDSDYLYLCRIIDAVREAASSIIKEWKNAK